MTWGLSFQRPDKRAIEQDTEAMRTWREETWPAVRTRAEAEGGEVLFADLVGIRSDRIAGRTWSEKGRTAVMRRTGNRVCVNAMSVISMKGRMWGMGITENFTATVMCRFLDRLARQFRHKIHLLVDPHSARRSARVRDWLATHADQPELHFLPAYAPELNPDELVNADLKRSLPASGRAHNRDQLADGTRPLLPPPTRPTRHHPRLLPRPTCPLRRRIGILCVSDQYELSNSGYFRHGWAM
ncbi:IS630 family transposase [Streptomyces acidicola]